MTHQDAKFPFLCLPGSACYVMWCAHALRLPWNNIHCQATKWGIICWNLQNFNLKHFKLNFWRQLTTQTTLVIQKINSTTWHSVPASFSTNLTMVLLTLTKQIHWKSHNCHIYSVLMVVVASSVSKLPDGNCQNCLCQEVYIFRRIGPSMWDEVYVFTCMYWGYTADIRL